MAQNEIKIIVTATGAEQAAKVLADVAKSGAQLGSITATGAAQADKSLNTFQTQLKATEAAFRQLGIGSAEAFQRMERAAQSDKIRAAFETIKTSSFASGAEVDKAAKAMQSSLSALNAGAAASGSGFKTLKTAASEASGTLAQAGINTGLFGQAMGALTSPIGLAAVGVAALGLAIKTTTDYMVKNYEQMRALMAVSGQSAEETDQLADAFDLLGFNVEALRGALFKMAAEVDSGGKGLRELGVSLRGVTGEIKTEGAIFLEVRNRISEMGSASERNAAAMKFFGRSAREMADVFALSTEEFTKWLEKAGMIGPSADDSLRVTKDYTRALTLFNKEWQGLVETIGIYVLPVLTAVITLMTRIREIRIGETTAEWDEFLTGVTDKTKAASAALAALAVDMAANEGRGLGAGQARVVPALTKAEVEDIKLGLKEVEAARLRSIDVVEARGQAAVKAEQMTAAQAAAQAITLAQQRSAARIAAIDGEIDAIRRTSTTEIKAGTEAHDKIRELTIKRADEHGNMATAVIAAEGSITAATLASQKAINDALGGLTQAMVTLASQTTLFPLTDEQKEIQAFNTAVEQTRSKLDELKKVLDPADWKARMKAFDDGTKHLRDWAAALAESKKAVDDAKKFYEELKEKWDAGAKSIEAMEFSYEKWIASLNANGALDEAKAFYEQLPKNIDAAKTRYESIQDPLDNAARASLAFQETLAGIQREAALVGRDFDLLGAKAAAYRDRILELQAIKNPTGDVLAEITRLKGEFADTKSLIFWRDAVRDVFGSISSAISTSVQGVILGTTTMAQAWSNLWKSIVLSFVNSGIQRLLKGVQDWLLGLFTGGSSGGFGEGIFGAIISGAGALVAKLSGGGTSLGNPVGSSAGALDLVTTAAKGTASALNAANTGISNFSAGVGAALSGLGVAAGIYGLTQGGSAGSMALSAGGTALSLYSLAVSASQLAVNAGLIGTALPTIGVLLAQGLATVAPTIAAAVGTAVYTAFGSSAVATALLGGGAAAAGGAAAGGAGVGAALGASAGASFLGFVAFMVAGGLAGIAADAEDAAESFKEQLGAVKDALNQAGAAGLLFANLGKHLQESNLAKSLEQLHGALRALGDLDLAVGLNQVIGDASSQGIMAQVPKLRATVGAAWLGALDAAFKQGVAPPIGSPGRDLTKAWQGNVGMQSFDDILSQAAGAGRDGFDKLTHLLEHISQSLDTSLYQVNATGVRMVDLGAVNALLDKEFLTTSLRNAVVDIGALFGIQAGQLGGIGAGQGEANWRATPGAGNMPSMAAIASAQAALEAAGFEPGKYAEALEKYLTSIDTNLVNNPAWKKFVDMLHKAGGDSGVLAVINKEMAKNMTPMQFYGVAKAATDSLTAALKEQMTARASETDTDALKAIDDSIAAMTETVKAWSSLVTLYTGLPVEMAAIGGDLAKQTATSIEAWRVQMQSFTDAIADSRKELDKAIAGGNITSIAAAAQAVHDQTIAQYNAVLKAVESLHKAIQGILEQAGILVDMMTSVAQLDIRSNGSFATIGSLLGSLQDIAEHGGTAAIRLFAIDKAIQAIIATLPTAIEKFGSEAGPAAITGSVAGAAAPFLAAQQGEINVAKGVALLALLQQQAQTINALATAAIAGVRQWADAAIKGARAAADEVIAGLTRERDAKLKQIDADIKGIEGVAAAYHQRHVDEIDAIQGVAKLYHEKAMAEIKAIEVAAAAAHDARMAEIDAIQETEDAAHEYRAAEMDALSELINKAQEMESAVASMGKFIDQLKQGPVGPGNPADKLALAQQSFAQALAAFNRNPTAGGLTDLQGLAQTMLSLAEPIFSKPSPQFQTLSATTIKQLMAAQALAAAQMTDSQILKAQLEHLQAIDKATTASVGEQIKAIQAADEAAGKKADTLIEVIKKRDEKEQALAEKLIKGIEDLDKMEQTIAKAMIKTLEDNRDKVTKDFETQTTAVELGLKNTILAIEKAAADEIDHIQKGTAIALQANMDKQIPLLAAQYDAANAQLVAIGDTKVWQTATLAKLEELRVLLAGATGAESGMTRVTEGLYHLHDDEMVLPKGTADRIRSAEMGAGLPDPTAQAVGEIITNWDKYSDAEKQGIITAYNAADEATKQSADRAASFWQASERQTERAAARPPDLSNTGPWAPGSGDPLRDPWMAHAVQTKAGDWIYEPGYGPGATPGSVVKFGTGPAPGAPPPGTAPTAPYLPPGPPWLYRGAGSTNLTAGGSMTYGGAPDGGGPITVVVKLDGKTIGEATLPTIQGDARSGKMRTIILETKAR